MRTIFWLACLSYILEKGEVIDSSVMPILILGASFLMCVAMDLSEIVSFLK